MHVLPHSFPPYSWVGLTITHFGLTLFIAPPHPTRLPTTYTPPHTFARCPLYPHLPPFAHPLPHACPLCLTCFVGLCMPCPAYHYDYHIPAYTFACNAPPAYHALHALTPRPTLLQLDSAGTDVFSMLSCQLLRAFTIGLPPVPACLTRPAHALPPRLAPHHSPPCLPTTLCSSLCFRTLATFPPTILPSHLDCLPPLPHSCGFPLGGTWDGPCVPRTAYRRCVVRVFTTYTARLTPRTHTPAYPITFTDIPHYLRAARATHLTFLPITVLLTGCYLPNALMIRTYSML